MEAIFYANVTPLTRDAHGKLRLKPRTGFGFADKTNAVPLTIAEFFRASQEYPIVFAGEGEGLHCAAVLGLKNEDNLFVGPDGQWQARYIPAYVRRYPFILAGAKDSDQLAVCLDPDCADLSKKEGEALFDKDGKQTAYLDRAIKFLQDFQSDFVRTRRFAQKVAELGLLQDVQADVSLNSGEKMRLAGLQVVSREKLQELTPEQCQELVVSSGLEQIYIHLNSLSNFQPLVNRMSVPAKAA